MIAIQYVVQLVARAEHHQVDDAQVGDELIGELLVADVFVTTQEAEVDAHFAESLLVVVAHAGTGRVDIVGEAEVFASATDNLRSTVLPFFSLTLLPFPVSAILPSHLY